VPSKLELWKAFGKPSFSNFQIVLVWFGAKERTDYENDDDDDDDENDDDDDDDEDE
jgi:hypothetical protein